MLVGDAASWDRCRAAPFRPRIIKCEVVRSTIDEKYVRGHAELAAVVVVTAVARDDGVEKRVTRSSCCTARHATVTDQDQRERGAGQQAYQAVSSAGALVTVLC